MQRHVFAFMCVTFQNDNNLESNACSAQSEFAFLAWWQRFCMFCKVCIIAIWNGSILHFIIYTMCGTDDLRSI